MSIVSRYTPPRRGAPGGKKWQLIILHYNSSLCYDKYAMTDGRHRTLLYPGIINRTKPARVLQATTEPVLSLKMYEHNGRTLADDILAARCLTLNSYLIDR